MKTLRVGEKVWVHWQGRLYGLTAARGRERSQDDGAQELAAPFSCKILKVHVKPGDSVKRGDPVVVAEAMKMEYTYASPRDGTVDQVLVQEGQTVSAGTQFVRWRQA